jgi:hypothetical protein
MIRHGIKVITAVAVLGVAGCGGDDDSNKALSYSDFSKQANEICQKVNDKTDPIGAKLTGKVETDAPVFAELIPEIQKGRDEFADLKPPEELKPTVDSFLAITDQQISQAKKAEAAAKAGDQAEYISIVKATQPLSARSKVEGSKLGAAECAK